MLKIKRDDEVVVISGKDKGRRGKVLGVENNGRILVSGVGVVKKHQKPNPGTGQPGGIIEREHSIHASKVAIFNPATQKGDRVGFRFDEGKKVRFFKSNNALIDA